MSKLDFSISSDMKSANGTFRIERFLDFASNTYLTTEFVRGIYSVSAPDVSASNTMFASEFRYSNGTILTGGSGGGTVPANLNVTSLIVGSNVIRLNSAIALFNGAVRIANTANIQTLLINTNSIVLQNTGATFNTTLNVANTLTATNINSNSIRVNSNTIVFNTSNATFNVPIVVGSTIAYANGTAIGGSGAAFTGGVVGNIYITSANTIRLDTTEARFNVPVIIGSTIAYANGASIASGGGAAFTGGVVENIYITTANTIKLDSTEARFNVDVQANTTINSNSITVNTSSIVLNRQRAQFNVLVNVASSFSVNTNTVTLNTTEARFNVPVIIGSTIAYANGASIASGGGGGATILDQLNDVTITTPTNGQVLTYDAVTSQWVNQSPATIGTGNVISVRGATWANAAGQIVTPVMDVIINIPQTSNIISWTVYGRGPNNADTTGSCVIDIWRTPSGTFPPISANSITGSSPPTITTAKTNSSSVLTGWSNTLSAGDTLLFRLSSCSNFSQVFLQLNIQS